MTMNEPPKSSKRSVRAKVFTPIFAGLLAASIALPCAAQLADAIGTATTDAIGATSSVSAMAERLQALYPSTRFGAVNQTAWPGVFEVVMGANLAYVDQSGQYFLFGHLYDMKTQRDLTAEHKDAIARIDFDTLPLADAMKEVRGNGSRVMAIFADPDCPYCQKLESDLRELTNVTIYTFLMPLVSLHPGAYNKAVSVWCAKDRIAAWHAAMWRGEMIPQTDCPHPVDRNVALGEQMGINGTPTLVAADGRMLPGAASKEQIEAWLERSPLGVQGDNKPEVLRR